MKKHVAVTLIGSFRKDPVSLKNIFQDLKEKYTLLSPLDIDWSNPEDEFLKVEADSDKSIKQIENRHLEAIRSSDFVVLFAPDGYVGTSGAFEVGFANGLGIPVLSTHEVDDQTISTMIDGLIDIDEVAIDYGRGLKVLQKQYAKIAKRNGWDDESARDTMLLMIEELGELARAIRKHEGLSRDGEFDTQLAEELADVQIYTAHLANTVNIDLGDAVTAKIIKNNQKKN